MRAWLDAVRTLYLAGDVTAAPSTRVAVECIRLAAGLGPAGEDVGCPPVGLGVALELCYLDLLPSAERVAAWEAAVSAGLTQKG
jgi:hypothetical protein